MANASASFPSSGPYIKQGSVAPGVGNIAQSSLGLFRSTPLRAVGPSTPDSRMRALINSLPEKVNASPTAQSNGSVTGSFNIRRWKDKSHARIGPGTIVFTMRYVEAERQNIHNIVSLARLNQILRDQHTAFLVAAKRGGSEENTFQRAMRTSVSEGDLWLYHEIKMSSLQSSAAQYETQLDAAFPGRRGDVAHVYKNAIGARTVYTGETMFGILHTWNFLGVCVTPTGGMSPATGLTTGAGFRNATAVTNLGIAVGKRAVVVNYWGNLMRPSTHCYLILKRATTGAPFQIVPYGSHKHDAPPADEMASAEENRVPMTRRATHAWHVGMVTRPPKTLTNTNQVRTAAGLNGVEALASTMAARMPQLEIQIGV